MLVLNRRVGETIRIGDCVVTVVQLKTGSVRLGIDAPSDTRIMRGEIPPEREHGYEGDNLDGAQDPTL